MVGAAALREPPAPPFALSLSKGPPTLHRHSCAGRNPEVKRGGGRSHSPPTAAHTPIVFPAKAGTQGRGAAQGRLRLSSVPPPQRVIPAEAGIQRGGARPFPLREIEGGTDAGRGAPTTNQPSAFPTPPSRRRGASRSARPAAAGPYPPLTATHAAPHPPPFALSLSKGFPNPSPSYRRKPVSRGAPGGVPPPPRRYRPPSSFTRKREPRAGARRRGVSVSRHSRHPNPSFLRRQESRGAGRVRSP